jgi:Uma2 family endonuclease
MSTATTAGRMTAEEFFDWVHRPENRDHHFELEKGEVIEVSRPGERHGFVCLNVGRALGNYTFQRCQGYVCSNDTGLILERDPDTVRGPDVMLYNQVRRYDDLRVRYSDEPPTLVVEVLSPTDRWEPVTRRVNMFLQRGVSLVWLVDPEGRTVSVCRVGQLPQVLEGDDEPVVEDVLPGFRCRVADFFYLPGEEVAPVNPEEGAQGEAKSG